MSTATTDQRATPDRLAAVVFAALLVATVGAFFVTQRLKRETPAVKRIAVPLFVSPNGDGRKDVAHFSFDLPKGDRVTVSILTAGGDEVRRILNDRPLGKGVHHFTWDGRDSGGRVPPDGLYFVRVILRDQARGATGRRGIQLVTKPPRPRILSVAPLRHPPGRAGAVAIRFAGPANPPPVFSVYRTDQPGPARLVARFQGARLSHVGTWNGRVAGHPAPAGTYAFAVTVENRALVSGSAPRTLPPVDRQARPRTGLTIAGLEAAAPLEPVAAGSTAAVPATGARGHVRWSIEPAGGGKPLRSGVGAAPSLRIGVPSSARTGLYLVRVRSGAGAAVLPLTVRGRGAAGAPVLVILPSISWQGSNELDDDGNGFADTLDDSRSVPLARPFAFGRPPPGVTDQEVPLLGFLDRHKLRYDVTTDLALARGQGPVLAGHRAVVLPGAERWLPANVQAQLRAFVTTGGRLASFGADSLRRSVTLTATRLQTPGAPARFNALGERTGESTSLAAPLVVFGDTLGLFANTDAFVGLFSQFDQSLALPRGVTPIVSAGRDQRHPALVGYHLGRGLVFRIGTPQWAAQLGDPEVATVTAQLWSLLSR